MTPTRYIRGVDWDGAKAQLAQRPAKPSGHPSRADDEVGRIAGDLATWFLTTGADLLVASRDGRLGDRREALTRAMADWPKICRRMSALEQAAPNAKRAGDDRDAAIQAIIEKISA